MAHKVAHNTGNIQNPYHRLNDCKMVSVVAHSSSASSLLSASGAGGGTILPGGLKYAPLYLSLSALTIGDAAANDDVYAPSSGVVSSFVITSLTMGPRMGNDAPGSFLTPSVWRQSTVNLRPNGYMRGTPPVLIAPGCRERTVIGIPSRSSLLCNCFA